MLDELAYAHAVILVEHRHGAELEQTHERRPHAQRAVAVGQILLREEHLRRRDAQLREGLRVDAHEVALAHGGATPGAGRATAGAP